MANPNVKVGMVTVGLQSANRQMLLTYFDGFITGIGHRNAPYLRIVLPCGNIREYNNREEVPVRSTQCECGEVNYKHWFIRYDQEDKC